MPIRVFLFKQSLLRLFKIVGFLDAHSILIRHCSSDLYLSALSCCYMDLLAVAVFSLVAGGSGSFLCNLDFGWLWSLLRFLVQGFSLSTVTSGAVEGGWKYQLALSHSLNLLILGLWNERLVLSRVHPLSWRSVL